MYNSRMTRTRITVYAIAILAINSALLFLIINNNKNAISRYDSATLTEGEMSTPILETNTPVIENTVTENQITDTVLSPTTSVSQPPSKPEPKITENKIPPVVTREAVKPTFSTTEILTLHNEARNEVGVVALTYSPTLALSAQKWSEELQRDNCEMRHDENTAYGENLYWAWQTGGTGEGLITTPSAVVQNWTSEKTDYNYAKNSCTPGKQCGHYTQIVWEETTEIGCGVSICRNENTQKEIWVCRYNPPGNYFGEKPY